MHCAVKTAALYKSFNSIVLYCIVLGLYLSDSVYVSVCVSVAAHAQQVVGYVVPAVWVVLTSVVSPAVVLVVSSRLIFTVDDMSTHVGIVMALDINGQSALTTGHWPLCLNQLAYSTIITARNCAIRRVDP